MATDIPLPATEQIGFRSPYGPQSALRDSNERNGGSHSRVARFLLHRDCVPYLHLVLPTASTTGWPRRLAAVDRNFPEVWSGVRYSRPGPSPLHPTRYLAPGADTARILKVSTYSLTLLSVGNYFTKAQMPRLLLTYFWVFATLLLVILKYSTSRFIRDWKPLRARQRRVLICGTTRETRRLFSYLLHSPHLGQIPVGFLDESGFDNRRVIYSHDYNLKNHVPVISEPLSESLLRSLDVQEIFVPPTISQPRMNELLALASAAGVRVSLVGAGHPYFAEHCTSVQMIDGLMVTTFDADGDHPLPYIAFKRCADLLLSSLLMLLTLPMWLVAAVMVKATSRGPVFFRQRRTGQSGKPFVMLKFRSMYVDAPKYGRSPENANDKRITLAGRFLRKTSLDELPQLLNVITGDMSLVGPRPEMPYITDTYTALERRRLSVPQGLTGLWQLSGDRRFSIHEAIEYDFYYIENRGIFLDFAILLHTLFFAMKGL